MIRLSKGPKPQVLLDNEATWTAEYAAHVTGVAGTPAAAATRYRHPEIKAAVKLEANEKCIYCESKVTHISPGDCEHLLPKSKLPELVVVWENLGFVCSICNQEKGDYYEPTLPLLNPFHDDPELAILWAGPFCSPADTATARQTVLLLDLDRAELVYQRSAVIKRIDELIQVWEAEPMPAARLAIQGEAERAGRPQEPYSAAVRAYLRWRAPW